jgi:transglutaminase/protease-like cytokinesis protein 3
MRIFILASLFLLTTVSLAGQTRIDQRVYDQVTGTSASGSLEELVKDLTSPFQTDQYKKAECIYLWIKLNIRYDFAEYASGSSSEGSRGPVPDPETVLKTRMGVCDEFSTLAKKMFELAGIKSEVITGWARPSSGQLFEHVNKFKHAWNRILIDGKWHFVDCTWASLGYAYGDSTDYFFMPPPEEFIYSHYPENKEWALLAIIPSFTEFEAFPFVTPLFFYLLHGKVPSTGVIHVKSDTVEIPAFMNPDPTIVLLLADTSTGEERSVPNQITFNAHHEKVFKIILLQKGVYLLSARKKYRRENEIADIYNLKELISFGIVWK